MIDPDSRVEPSVAYATLLGRCPRCGRGKLFAGFLKIAPACGVCGLDYSRFDAGDGPAVFALIVEVKFSPPYWVHAVIWGPMVLILSLGLLRPLKAGLVVLQYKHRAEEGRISH